MKEKVILCYGDSNTFGYNCENGCRFSKKMRWSGLVGDYLSAFKIIEEGLNNRTLCSLNSDGEKYCGDKYFFDIISRIEQVDILILSLGINDLQSRYNISNIEFQTGLENICSTFISFNSSGKIVITLPPVLTENLFIGSFGSLFAKSSLERSREIREIYLDVARKLNCVIFDPEQFVSVSEIDGLHYDKNAHLRIAKELSSLIKNYLL